MVLTKWYLFSRICRQQEDEQSQARDEHTGNEQVQTIIQCSPAHRYCKSHVRVWLLTALIIQLITLPRDPWQNTKEHIQIYFVQQQVFSTNAVYFLWSTTGINPMFRYCHTLYVHTISLVSEVDSVSQVLPHFSKIWFCKL